MAAAGKKSKKKKRKSEAAAAEEGPAAPSPADDPLYVEHDWRLRLKVSSLVGAAWGVAAVLWLGFLAHILPHVATFLGGTATNLDTDTDTFI